MERIRLIQLGVCVLVALTAGCGGGGGGSSSQAIAPPAQTFSYSIQGSAIKGVISGATISVINGDGVVVSGASATSGADGSFTIDFSTTTQVIEPVQISLSGSDATAVCDVSPSCEYGVDAQGNTLAVSFGETYSLPEDFNLRATITSLTANGDNRSGTAFISPLSDFVTELALDMGSGQNLTATNLDVANLRVVAFIQSVYPTLDAGQLTEISLVPLIDLTNLEGALSDNLTELNLAVSSLSAAVAGFVDAQNSERQSITDVMDEFNAEILLNQETGGVLLNIDADSLLGSETVTVISDAVTRLDNLVATGTVTLPTVTSIANLDLLLTGAAGALPEITDIWTNLTPGQQTTNVQSDAVGWSDLILIPSTGKLIISVETTGLTAVAAHLHQSYAGTDGPVIVGLEQDPGNADRWRAPSDATLSEEQIAAVMRGETYINVHTAENQAGEIRGQLLPENVLLLVGRPDGQEQVPLPVTTDGFAVAAVTLDQGTNIAQVHLTSSLNLAAAHIHSAIAGTNGSVVVPMDLDAAVAGHWFATDVDLTELNDELVSAGLYFNLHTAEHPAGEIRAQIAPESYQVLFSTLDASQAVSAETVDSIATGVSAMTLNLATRDFSFHVNTTGVEDAVAAHIHAADAGINGPVIFPLEQSVLDLNHWSTENQTFSAEQLTSFLAGDMYVNVHTPAYPAGEIRGQLTAQAPGFEDSDGDGVINKDDAFPEDASESTDTDGDGVGDNADACPTDPAETQDSDGDGICDNSDPIDNSVDADGDGVNDSQDAFPNDPNESVDSDGDGVGDNGDNCPSVANPGQENSDGVGPGDACEVPGAPSFSEIQAIFNSRCVACHGISGGLSLASNVSHNNLVNTASSQIPSLDRVVPGDSENSYLIWKIEGRSGIVGARMPFGGPFLSQDLVDQIRAWIDAGASE